MRLNQETGRDNPLTTLLDDAFNSFSRGLMVCLPGRITTFDSATQRAQVELGVRPVVNGEPMEALTADNVPVQFAGDSQWYHWHQITPGETEGIIVFSQRNMEAWKQQGGPAIPTDRRTFSGADAMFIPGIRSAPNAIPSLQTSGAGISNYAGDVSITLDDGAITLVAGGQTLTLDSSGLKHNGTNVGDTHVHPQGNDSGGNTEQDTGGPQ